MLPICAQRCSRVPLHSAKIFREASDCCLEALAGFDAGDLIGEPQLYCGRLVFGQKRVVRDKTNEIQSLKDVSLMVSKERGDESAESGTEKEDGNPTC